LNVQQVSTKLLTHYEAIRRQEHEAITALQDTLERIDGLPEQEMEQVRDALFHANHPFLMVLVGPFGSGKSSIINALLGSEVMEVGPIPTTDRIVILRRGADEQRSRSGDVETIFFPSPILENLSLVDTPGLESVFRVHDEVTRRFLHRADVVVLVMIATQVFTAANLEYLQQLKAYGKRTIIIVNQIDLLEEADREKIREFVREQSRLQLGIEPKVWLVSAKQALAAQQESPRDEILWDQSGFADIEDYIKESLGNIERLRQKLETPVQICLNTTKTALKLVQDQQAALDNHRKTTENIAAQIDQGRREQQLTVDTTLREIENAWNEATARGDQAIGELFQFSRAIGMVIGGLGEILGIGRLFRRLRGKSLAEDIFEEHKVRETLAEIPKKVSQLGPRLEGRDLQDIDDLVDYTRNAVQNLPPSLAGKMVGKIQTPLRYERSALREVGGTLDDIVRDAERFETGPLERTLRSMLVLLALWEVLTLCLVLAVAGGAFGGLPDSRSVMVVLGVGLGLILFGLMLVPLRGWMLRQTYTRRMHGYRDKYLDLLRKASNEIVAHGVQLRRDSVAPFTRLIESQAELIEDQRKALSEHQQTLIRIQGGLAEMSPKLGD